MKLKKRKLDNYMVKSLYIHIPFCRKICPYCAFVRQLYQQEKVDKYLVLIEKLINTKYKNNKFQTIYIGGGTPNCLTTKQLIKLLSCLVDKLSPKYEFTIECNPELVTKQQVKIFKQYKINRISLGMQTLNKKILKTINRLHNYYCLERAIKLFKKFRINNLSCDLIYGFNQQSIPTIKKDLDFLLKNKIKHISCYCLEIKPKTIFAQRNYKLDENINEEHLKFIIKYLKQKNYFRYEVSNWCKTKKDQSHHNVLVWKTNEWVGIGWGAHGFEKNVYYHYEGSILKWKLIRKRLTKKELYQQVLIMGLRLKKGLNLNNKLVNKSYYFFKKELNSSPLFINEKKRIKCRNINLLNCLLEKII